MAKILGVIDSLGSGGAQRQMINLLLGLQKQGHQVELFTYVTTSNFFKETLMQAHVPIHHFEKPKKGFSIAVIRTLRKVFKQNRYEITLSFLDGPNIYHLLAGVGLPHKKIVSERSSFLQEPRLWRRLLMRQLFRVADAVVTNSYSEAEWLSKHAKLPSPKITTIYNGYLNDTYSFQTLIPMKPENLSLIGIGRINPVKNIELIIEGLAMFEKIQGWIPHFTWVGRVDNEGYFNHLQTRLKHYPSVKEKWTWAGEVQNAPMLFQHHHALVLPSFYEGLPNVICEAFFSGLPVLASNRCDNPRLVEDQKRGFLFDPLHVSSFVDALMTLVQGNETQWKALSINAHTYATKTLTIAHMIARYESVFKKIL